MKSKKIAFLGICLAISLIVSYIEYLLPILSFIPGAKLGLSNIIFLIMIDRKLIKEATLINVSRIIISSILFGSASSLIYSMCGAILAFGIMIILTRFKCFSFIGISIAAAVLHNIGQLIAAFIILGTPAVISYVPYLLIIGTVCGLLSGILSLILNKYTKNIKI